jgi:nucleoside-diphosphate-sugar epimerase
MAKSSADLGVKRLFFSSSVCVYPVGEMNQGRKMREEDVLPASPNETYGWEKLISEIRYIAYGQEGKLNVRIARFDNTYGPECDYKTKRAKAPAALCRKVVEAKDEIEVWGDGSATRHFLYIDDLLDGIYKLMHSDYLYPVNLGTDELVKVNQLAQMIIDISGKDLKIKNVEGEIGAKQRRISHDRAKEILKWEAETKLKDGIEKTYKWIERAIG